MNPDNLITDNDFVKNVLLNFKTILGERILNLQQLDIVENEISGKKEFKNSTKFISSISNIKLNYDFSNIFSLVGMMKLTDEITNDNLLLCNFINDSLIKLHLLHSSFVMKFVVNFLTPIEAYVKNINNINNHEENNSLIDSGNFFIVANEFLDTNFLIKNQWLIIIVLIILTDLQ